MKQRIQYFDCLRGLAIMMVVGIHTYTLSDSLLPMSIRQVFNCAVPLFLAISGYFLSNKDVSNKEKYMLFVQKQVPKVYIPCLLWSLPLFIMDFIKGSFGLSSIVFLFFCGYSIYYFVALIIQYYLLLPILQTVKTHKTLGWMCLVSIFCVGLVTYLLHFKHLSLPLIAFAGPFPLWIAFFCEGIYIANRGRDYNLWLIVIFTILTLVSSVLETRYIYSLDGGGTGIKPSSYLFSFFCILLLFSSKTEKFFVKLGWFYRLLVWMGSLSFGIYLCHCYILAVMSILPTFFNYWILRWALILLLSSIIVAIGKKYFSWTVKYLGFR